MDKFCCNQNVAFLCCILMKNAARGPLALESKHYKYLYKSSFNSLIIVIHQFLLINLNL